jgi:superoxide dismutase, Fe-Mn family
MKRKSFLKSTIASALGLGTLQSFATTIFRGKSIGVNQSLEQVEKQATVFSLPALAFANDALEPHFDKLTMEIHHDRHHKAYVDNLNKAVVGTPYEKMTLSEILKNIKKNPAIQNNGGGHWNHTFFWETLSPKASAGPSGALLDAINNKFGSLDKFKEEFAKAGMGRFGSGWAWLIVKNKAIEIVSTPNQDNPLMLKVGGVGGTPILGLDVWEHAYYLKYQNKRADYIKAFWNVVNWAKVEERFDNA